MSRRTAARQLRLMFSLSMRRPDARTVLTASRDIAAGRARRMVVPPNDIASADRGGTQGSSSELSAGAGCHDMNELLTAPGGLSECYSS
jgi:hypothetical protein